MARIPGVEKQQAGWFIRFAYRAIEKKIRRVVLPLKIAAHHPRLFRAVLSMERGQAAAQTVPADLKTLVQVKAAMLVGCPF
jgi:hypothetical protein